ncbi:MAG: RepB family DNA primase [Xanthobacteraceae bacterium]|nr:RepB family DNA primase [Xanthobacteraceae bacterium]
MSACDGARLLEALAPSGPWNVSAIPTFGGAPEEPGRNSFDVGPHNVDGPKGLFDWIGFKQQDSRNIYLHVAVGNTKKAKLKKSDVKEVRALWVDCDPDPQRYEDSRAEILDRMHDYHLKPSCIVDSGNGYQAYWFLDEPFVVDGDEDRISEFERYTRQLYYDFEATGGDGCWSIEHLMRLPGTINIETQKKVAKGYPRGNRDARIVEWNEEESAHV